MRHLASAQRVPSLTNHQSPAWETSTKIDLILRRWLVKYSPSIAHNPWQILEFGFVSDKTALKPMRSSSYRRRLNVKPTYNVTQPANYCRLIAEDFGWMVWIWERPSSAHIILAIQNHLPASIMASVDVFTQIFPNVRSNFPKFPKCPIKMETPWPVCKQNFKDLSTQHHLKAKSGASASFISNLSYTSMVKRTSENF